MEISKRSLEFFPVQLFAVIMGVSGLTVVFEKAHQLLGIPSVIYGLLLTIDTVLFIGILSTYIYKWFIHPQAVKKEYMHPIKSSFMAAISISFLLVSIAYNSFSPTIAKILWFIGTPLQLAFTLYVIRYWIHNDLKVIHSNPAWFIPIVGNILVPIVGVDVAPQFISIFFFSIGFFFWIILFAIMLYRIIFHHPLAKKLIPTFFIFIAPPAVGFVSYYRITGSIDLFALSLYSLALFTLMLLIFMIRMFDTKEFFISWWAYTFPMAAITLATLILHQTFNSGFTYALSLLLIITTTLIVGFVTFKTYQAIRVEEICISEEG